MIKPKNQAERKAYKESCIASYEQEIKELSDVYSNINDFYYSDHLGVWILKYKNGDDQEFDSKIGMLEWLAAETE